jgi:hypothetical protein
MSILRARFISTQHRSTQVKSAQLISTYLISAELYWVQKFFQPLMWFDQGSKYRSKSDCEAKRKRNFFREKLRSEAKIFFVCAKRSGANNFSKLRKIAKNWDCGRSRSQSEIVNAVHNFVNAVHKILRNFRRKE